MPVFLVKIFFELVKLNYRKKIFIFSSIYFARDILSTKKLEIEETKTTLHSTFKTDIMKMGLVFSISNFFHNKSSLANKWMSFSFSNSALEKYIHKVIANTLSIATTIDFNIE